MNQPLIAPNPLRNWQLREVTSLTMKSSGPPPRGPLLFWEELRESFTGMSLSGDERSSGTGKGGKAGTCFHPFEFFN